MHKQKILILYSTTFGTSEKYSELLEETIQERTYSDCERVNVGDISPQYLLKHSGPTIFILSTYGAGESPRDGIAFLNWIRSLQTPNLLANIKYAILGLGCSRFLNFCHHSLLVEEALRKVGAKQILKIQLCDSSSDQKDIGHIFPPWSQKLVNILNEKDKNKNENGHQSIKDRKNTETHEPNYLIGKVIDPDWEAAAQSNTRLKRESREYFSASKAKVIFVEELKKDNKRYGNEESTLHVRLQKPNQFSITPACNILLYPENTNLQIISPQQSQDFVIFKSVLESELLKFPSMPLNSIKRLVDVRNKPSKKQIRAGLKYSKNQNVIEEVIRKYQDIQKNYNEKIENTTIQTLIQDLHPQLQFYEFLKFNTPRPYTVASYHPKYIDLCISCIKGGLASQFLLSKPHSLRITNTTSKFQVTEGNPLIVIANGTGIAPFRSICQYVKAQPATNRVPLTLYFGIKDSNFDFYFEEEFTTLQNDGILKLRLAESRKDPKQKIYVQNLLRQDREAISEHLLKKKGKIFMCGKEDMIKQAKIIIYESIQGQFSEPFEGYRAFKKMIAQGLIVDQAFH